MSTLIVDLKTIFASNMLFLKHYGQVRFINFRVEAAKHSALVRSIRISKYEFQNIKVLFPKEQVNQLKATYQPLLRITSLFVTMKFLGNNSNRYLLELK